MNIQVPWPGADPGVDVANHVRLERETRNAGIRQADSTRKATHAELLILGSEPAGYSAAVQAARANLRPLWVTGAAREDARRGTAAPGGDLPREADIPQGTDLKRRLREHAERASTRVAFDAIKWVNLARLPFHVQGKLNHYTCDALIIAVDRPTAQALFQGQLEMKDGHIVTYTGLSGMATQTSLQGVFVAGDALDPALEPVITRTGTGCMAVLDAQRYLGS